MKRLMSKIFILLSIVLIVVSLVGCKRTNNDEKPPIDITLPTEVVKAKSDEVIFVTYNEDGILKSMTASNHISNSSFINYQQYGSFLQSNNLNITSPDAKIKLEEDYALIPSLDEYDSFFYLLNLDKEHYNNKLPFNITTKYLLDGNEVKATDLSKSNGQVKLMYEIKPNILSNVYYQSSFAMQIQIPINLANANIINAPNTMSKVLVGKTMTLAYMVMPGQSLDIEIELEVKNFKFAGFEAVMMPFNLLDMAKDLINAEALGLDQFTTLEAAFEMMILEFSNANNEMSMFFDNLGHLNDINSQLDLSLFSQFEELIEGINNDQLHQGYTSLISGDVFSLLHKDKVAQFIEPVKLVRKSTSNLTSKYEMLKKQLEILEVISIIIEPATAKYQQSFKLFSTIIQQFESMKVSIGNIVRLDLSDLDLLMNNKDLIVTELNNLDTKINLVKQYFQKLINSMYPLAEELGAIVNSIDNVINSVISIYEELSTLIVHITTLAGLINNGLDNGWFNIIVRDRITTFRDSLTNIYSGSQEPGLIQMLELAKAGFEQYNFEEIKQSLEPLKDMFVADMETYIRPIDMFHLGFSKMNETLLLKQENMPFSFYDSINMIVSLKNILELLPPKLEGELPSFLSDKNDSPNSLQFVIKHSGF